MQFDKRNIDFKIHLRKHLKVLILLYSIFLYSVLLAQDSTFVEKHGLITVNGNRLLEKNDRPIVLRGMSLFWSQWEGEFYNYDCIKWLRDDWNCTVVRAAMGVESGGYLEHPASEKAKIKTVIGACIDLGIYVIVDWHDHNAQEHRPQAIAFFQEIAQEYGEYPNVIYEIFNEPEQDNWNTVVKPYLSAVADSIRAIDPDNLIVVGTPTWSQDVDIASSNPLSQNNIAYALHFYAAYQYHKQNLRNKATTALNNGLALFVTEFGTVLNTGDGPIDTAETRLWMNFMENNQISWCNWSIADKNETSAALKSGAASKGGWPDSILTESGSLIRNYIIQSNRSFFDKIIAKKPVPTGFTLEQNYPNPFNSSTQMDFELPVGANIDLKIYDLYGNMICTLIQKSLQAGRYQIAWQTSQNDNKVASGVYLAQLIANFGTGTVATSRKLTLLK